MNKVTWTAGPATSPASTTRPETVGGVSRGEHDERQAAASTEPVPSGGFLGVGISVSMDVTKWAWPSFGKNFGRKEAGAGTGDGNVAYSAPGGCAEAQVDQSALEDAMASENSYTVPTEKSSTLHEHEKPPVNADSDVAEADTPRPSRVPSPTLETSKALLDYSLPSVDVSATTVDDAEKPQFTWTNVFLAPSRESLATFQRRVYLLKVSTNGVVI